MSAVRNITEQQTAPTLEFIPGMHQFMQEHVAKVITDDIDATAQCDHVPASIPDIEHGTFVRLQGAIAGIRTEHNDIDLLSRRVAIRVVESAQRTTTCTTTLTCLHPGSGAF